MSDTPRTDAHIELRHEFRTSARYLTATHVLMRQMEQELDACRKDAERYRWLREHFDGDTWVEHCLADICPFKFAGPDSEITSVALDDGIDAAIKECP